MTSGGAHVEREIKGKERSGLMEKDGTAIPNNASVDSATPISLLKS
jgi:hypothetical protein